MGEKHGRAAGSIGQTGRECLGSKVTTHVPMHSFHRIRLFSERRALSVILLMFPIRTPTPLVDLHRPDFPSLR